MPPPPPYWGGGNHFMEGYFTFQLGEGGGSDGETSFLSGRGAPHGEDIGFDGGFLKKIVGWGRVPPPPSSQVCKYITETNTFTGSVTGETYKINHCLDCNDKCLVYFLTCNKCKKKTMHWSNY